MITHIEIIADFDNSFYANVSQDGKLILGLPEYVTYRHLKKAIKEKIDVNLPILKNLKFTKCGRKFYAYYNKEV